MTQALLSEAAALGAMCAAAIYLGRLGVGDRSPEAGRLRAAQRQ